MKFRSTPLLVGVASAVALVVLYAGTMRLSGGSWYAAIIQFRELRIFMVPLVFLFGVHMALYAGVRRQQSSRRTAAAATGFSSVGMIACCAHHLSDIVPLVGLSVVATFLSAWQKWFLAIGIASNIIGIVLFVQIRNQQHRGHS